MSTDQGKQIRQIQLKKWWVVVLAGGLVGLLAGGDVFAEDGSESSAIEVPHIEEPSSLNKEETNHPALDRSIAAVLADREMQLTTVGIHVVDVGTGEVLYTKGADVPMNPASNIKLLTAAVILDELGPNHTFSTELSTREMKDGRIDHLYIKGEGEAFLLFKDVLSWAGELRMQGVEAIDGDLVIDDEIFDGAYLPPGYDLRDADASYRSSIGAVSVNFNAITATVKAGDEVGQRPVVRLDPPNDHVEVINQARTTRGSLPRIAVSAVPSGDGTRLIIGGTIGINASSVAQRKRIDNPPAFAGSVVAKAMEMVGIEFDGEVLLGAVPEERERLMVHDSQPVINSVAAMNKWSNNFIAEQLLRVMGTLDDEPSTWEASRALAEQSLEQHGFIHGTYKLNNGSGLYDGNEVSPRQFVDLLRLMMNHPYGPEFISSLAIAGVDGTLRHRLDDGMTQGNLRGKTGTLRDVTALSGYMHTRSGRHVAFSILFNDPPRRAWNFRSKQDDIARAIAEFDE